MNASCINENAKFKLCPYRVYTEEHPPVLRGNGAITTQQFYPCLGEACVAYHVGVCLRLSKRVKEVSK
nr:MAG TPA: hypothetical protein [Caudoviricetes sp.]